MKGARIINRRPVLLNPEGSPAFDAGYKWLLQRIKTAKGSFSTEPGALAYLKKQGLEGTRDLSRVEALGHPQVMERIERAQAMYEDFIDGASRAHEDRIHRYDEEYHAYMNPGYLYKPLLRPAVFAGLPKGWDYAEAPPDLVHRRRDIPASSWRYGIIRYDRRLSHEEETRNDLEYVGEG